MEITMFITPFLLAVLGIIIRFGKASWLIAGYNTSSKEEKEEYDEAALCKFVGNLLFVIAGIFLLIGVVALLKLANFAFIVIMGSLLSFFIIIGAVIYANTGNRFRKL